MLEPRLRQEAGANAALLAQAQESLLVDVLQQQNPTRSDALGALDRLLLLTDASTQSPYFVGISLEVDYDLLQAEDGALDVARGASECPGCFAATVELYSDESSELLGVASFLVSDAFFERLRQDVRNKVITEGVTILLLHLAGWGFVAYLVRRLQRSELGMRVAWGEARVARDQAEAANKAKSAFLANMSHEIRTPMNAILGYAQILGVDKSLDEGQRESVKAIDTGGKHLLGLINDILDISKIEAGREELHTDDFDLRGLLHDLESMFAMRCGQRDLAWSFSERLTDTVVNGDEVKLRQVLINLLGNAVKFTQDGGVSLEVEQLEQEDHVAFSVTDTGAGIPQEKQASVFEAFRQEGAGLRHGGTGLGLAISSRHVKMMGGVIEVESEIGKGSRFSFTLKLPAGAERQLAAADGTDCAAVKSLPNGRSVSALIVDDVETNREVLAQLLRRIGVTVDTANDGLQGLERVRSRLPDIVFMDIRMPRLDGPGALRRLHEEFGPDATKIVAVTASVFEHERQGFMDMGFSGFIDKPIRLEQVYKCLAEDLGIDFEFEEAPVDADEATDWRGVKLPQELQEQLELAALSHNVSELRRHLDDVERLGEEGESFASHLRSLVRTYDMDSIKGALQEVKPA